MNPAVKQAHLFSRARPGSPLRARARPLCVLAALLREGRQACNPGTFVPNQLTIAFSGLFLGMTALTGTGQGSLVR